MAVLLKDGPENARRDTRNSGKQATCRCGRRISLRFLKKKLPRLMRGSGNRAFLRSFRGRRGGSRVDPTDLGKPPKFDLVTLGRASSCYSSNAPKVCIAPWVRKAMLPGTFMTITAIESSSLDSAIAEPLSRSPRVRGVGGVGERFSTCLLMS